MAEGHAQSSSDSLFVDRIREALDGLTERERMLLKVMLGVFAVLAVVVIVGLVRRSIAELEQETQQYQAALELLAEEGPAYARAQSGGESDGDNSRVDLFTEEVLNDNSLVFSSEINPHAEAIGIGDSIRSFENNEDPIGEGDDGPIVIERQATIDLRNVELEAFLELLHRLEEDQEPYVIKRVDIHSVRDPGKIRAILVVSTYEYGEEEES